MGLQKSFTVTQPKAREMSLALGDSESENERTLPSLTGFVYFCEYFSLTPQEFFNKNDVFPQFSKELMQEFEN